jgi:hypothetical protein
MKIQCSCGAKYSFDVTPAMAQTPVQFVCPACGVNASDMVNRLIRQELGLPATDATPAPAPVAPRVRPPPQAPPVSRLWVQVPEVAPVEAEPNAADTPQRCFKHPGQFVVDKCHVCSKPLCPKCMELFGYVCSPLCRARAEAQGMEIPVYAEQKSVKEARTWRRTVAAAGTIAGLVVAALGVWFWYAWFGSVPSTVWSVRFAEPSYSGQTAFCGPDQIVFLHGDTLARHDMKLKKEIWSRHLVDKQEIEAAVARQMKAMRAVIDRANSEDPDNVPKMSDPEKLRKNMQRELEAALDLRVRGENIWVLSPGKLTRYDRETGSPVKEIPVPAGYGGLIPRGDELLNVDLRIGRPVVTRINLNTCETSTEEISGPPPGVAGSAPKGLADATLAGSVPPTGTGSTGNAGLPVGTPGRDAGKVMDPQKVAEQEQHLSLPARIALPAIIAHNMNQERTLAAYDDKPGRDRSEAAPVPQPVGSDSLIPTKDGFVQFTVKLLESRLVTRDAMKPPPAKSVLNGNLTTGNSAELANEMLNDAQRSRGGQVVREDESRYLVSLQRPGTADAWSGEVVGRPSLFPLATVNVLTADKTVLVFDEANRKLWQAALSYNVSGGYRGPDAENALYGLGPCVERKNSLYVIDAGVLTAFDLATGNARWRLPSVGITGLFFDDQGMIYLNTSTASPETLKYPNQIDITRKDSAIVMKIEPATGKVLWTANTGGLVNYVSGKFIYSVYAYHADDDEESGLYTADSILGRESVLSIKRLNPKNGRVMWEHVQQRAPLDVQFDQNTIRLVFKREVQVLKFLAL